MKTELPELNEAEAAQLRKFIMGRLWKKTTVAPTAVVAVAVNIVAQFPLRCKRG
jgi:hypothetical protein